MTQPAIMKPRPSFGGAWTELQTLPRWALAGIVASAGLIAWWLFKPTPGSQSTNQVWSNQATSYLTQRGYSPKDAQAATNAYSSGQALTQQQVSLVSEAVAAVGTPDLPTNTQPIVPSGRPSANQSTTTNGSYWKVTSMGVGWTSTFRGIAQQFYGDSSDSQYISVVNPGITPSDFSQIPVGTVIKVPRSLT